MKNILAACALLLSTSAFASNEVCSITQPYWDSKTSEAILRVMCTNGDTKVWSSPAIDNNYLPAHAKVRSEAVKYLLDLGYKPIDGFTFSK